MTAKGRERQGQDSRRQGMDSGKQGKAGQGRIGQRKAVKDRQRTAEGREMQGKAKEGQ